MQTKLPLGKISVDGPSFLILGKPAIICGGIGIILLGVIALTHKDAFFGSLFVILGTVFIISGFYAKKFNNISRTEIVFLTPEEFIVNHYYHIPLTCVTDIKYSGWYDKWGIYIGFEILISPIHSELGNSIFFLVQNRKMKKTYKNAQYFTQSIMKQVFICKKIHTNFKK